jgi:outer membrane protein assembly factor BamB
MLSGGITQYGTFQLGGLALLDTTTLAPVWEVPITMLSPAGNVVTRNPIDVDVVDGKLRVHLAPDDNSTTVLTDEAQL